MPKVIVRVIDAYVFNRKNKEIRFLLLKRAKTKIYEHLWQGVAGKIEAGETSWEAAIRELKEETGFEPVRIFVADHVSKFYEAHGDWVNMVPVFGIEVEDEEVILSDEHCEFKWVDFNTAHQTLIWSGQKDGITAIFNMLNSDDDRIKWSEISF
tara:strand:- start:1743 stop:2204 length:462 start_codon:yes stop_codon:yes gene_type:complete